MVPQRFLVLGQLAACALLGACAAPHESYRPPPIVLSAGSVTRHDAAGRPELNPPRILQVGDSLGFRVAQRVRGGFRDHPGLARGWRWRLANDWYAELVPRAGRARWLRARQPGVASVWLVTGTDSDQTSVRVIPRVAQLEIAPNPVFVRATESVRLEVVLRDSTGERIPNVGAQWTVEPEGAGIGVGGGGDGPWVESMGFSARAPSGVIRASVFGVSGSARFERLPADSGRAGPSTPRSDAP